MNREKTIVAINVAAHALTHVAELCFPATALLVLGDFFGAQEKYAELGRATFVSALLYGLAALPAGRLVDRLGSFRVLLIFLFGVGLSLLALAVMPSFFAFTVALGSLGFFSGLFHPAGTTMISLGVREHGKAMGAMGMGGNFGLAITPFFAAALASLVSWRAAYAILGALPILLGVFLILSGARVAVAASPAEKAERQNGPATYRTWPLVLLFSAAMFNGMAYRGFTTFFPVYFAENVRLAWLHLPKVTLGGAITTAILCLGIAGQMLGGRLADRVKKETLYAVIFALTVPLMFALSLLTDLPLVLTAGAFAFFYFANQPVSNSILPRYTSARVRGTIYGLFFFMSFGAGSFMSWVAGVVGERYELKSIFLMLAAPLAVSAVLGFFLVRATRD